MGEIPFPPIDLRTLDAEKIPKAIVNSRKWICWIYGRREDKITKIPVAPWKTGSQTRPIAVNDPDYATTFEEAYRTALNYPLKMGIGFTFYSGAHLTGVDGDHTLEDDGSLTDIGKQLLELIPSYAEYSPSRKGIHIIAEGTLSVSGFKNQALGVEAYSADRFFTFTGDHINGTPPDVVNCQNGINEVEKRWRNTEKKQAPKDGGGFRNRRGDRLEDILERSDKLRTLLEPGPGAYPSDSEADAATTCSLLFWEFNEEDVKEILTTYRGREKLTKNRTYLDRTIESGKKQVTKTISDYEREAKEEQDRIIAKIGQKDIFPDQILEIYRHTIKDDDIAVQHVFLHALSAYIPEPASLQNIAQTSEGKTHTIEGVCRAFPGHDVLNLGGLSPTALVHEVGEWVDRVTGESRENEFKTLYDQLEEADYIEKRIEAKREKNRVKKELKELRLKSKQIINLENKIILMLDRPNPKTLEMLKPILSHDRFEIDYKITDRTDSTGLKTKTVTLRGWPVIMVAATSVPAEDSSWAEIVSRFDIISPNQTTEKYRAAVQLNALKSGLPTQILSDRLQDKDFENLKTVISAISNELKRVSELHKRGQSFTPNPFWIPFYERIGQLFPAEVGRNMRDATRFLTLLRMVAAANIFTRPRIVVDGVPSIIVTRKDMEIAEALWFGNAAALMSGVPEKLIRFYNEVIMPCWEDCKEYAKKINASDPPLWVTTKDMQVKYSKVYGREINANSLRKLFLDGLMQGGFIDSQPHPTDRRSYHHKPMKETQKYGEMRETIFSSVEFLKGAIETLKTPSEKYGNRSDIHNIEFTVYGLENPNIEQIYSSYFCDSIPVFQQGDKKASHPKPTPELTEKINPPYNHVNIAKSPDISDETKVLNFMGNRRVDFDAILGKFNWRGDYAKKVIESLQIENLIKKDGEEWTKV